MGRSDDNIDVIVIPLLYERAAEAVCYCVGAAADLIDIADRDSMNAVNPRELRSSLASGFASLTYGLIQAETDTFVEVRRVFRELYARPPKPLGDISGPSYNDMGLRFAERTFDSIQTAADLRQWKIPIRRATPKYIHERAAQIGLKAELVLPRLWQTKLNCPAQRLKDYIENESAKGIKAWRKERFGRPKK